MRKDKPSKRRMPLDIRAIIKRRLKEIGQTPHWLSNQQRIVHPATVRGYLYGDRKDTTGRVLGELLAIIGLDITALEITFDAQE